MIHTLRIWLHVVLRGHRPDWRWVDVNSWMDFKVCARCEAYKRGLQ